MAAVPATLGPVREVLVDSGFFSEAAVRGSPIHHPPLVPSAASAVEQNAEGEPRAVSVYAALERQSHHRGVSELEARAEPEPPPPGAGVAEVMRHRLATSAGRAKYGLRKQTVEPVFGIIKEALGFRRFLLRGLAKVSLEWTLVSLAWNFKRLATLGLRERLAIAR